jgi:hypothetical protein
MILASHVCAQGLMTMRRELHDKHKNAIMRIIAYTSRRDPAAVVRTVEHCCVRARTTAVVLEYGVLQQGACSHKHAGAQFCVQPRPAVLQSTVWKAEESGNGGEAGVKIKSIALG